MPASFTPEELRSAIEQLRPELPGLLGTDYSTFVEKLGSILAQGDETQLLDWLRGHPTIYERLFDILSQIQVAEEDATTRGSLGLDDDIVIPVPSIQYWCDEGSHAIAAKDVVGRNAENKALCPQHGTAMEVVRQR